MRQWFFILIVLFISTTSVGQEYIIDYGDKRYMKYHYYCSQDYGFTLKEKLRDGKYSVYSKEYPGVALIIGNYKNRKRTGNWTIYNPVMKKTEFQTFEDGNLTQERGVDSLGRKTMEIVYTADSIFSIIYTYDYPVNSTGVASCVEEKRKCKKDNVYISKSTCFYPGGQLNDIVSYKNGYGHGKSIKYYITRQVKMEYENWNGKQVGIWKWYSENGVLTKEIDYGPK